MKIKFFSITLILGSLFVNSCKKNSSGNYCYECEAENGTDQKREEKCGLTQQEQQDGIANFKSTYSTYTVKCEEKSED